MVLSGRRRTRSLLPGLRAMASKNPLPGFWRVCWIPASWLTFTGCLNSSVVWSVVPAKDQLSIQLPVPRKPGPPDPCTCCCKPAWACASRLSETDGVVESVDAHAQAGLQQQVHGSGGPGLRGTGNWIESWSFAGTTLQTTEEFRQPVKVNQDAGIQQTRQNPGSGFFEAIARKPGSNERVVMRPDRTIVIRDRVVAQFPGAYGAHSPAIKEVRA